MATPRLHPLFPLCHSIEREQINRPIAVEGSEIAAVGAEGNVVDNAAGRTKLKDLDELAAFQVPNPSRSVLKAAGALALSSASCFRHRDQCNVIRMLQCAVAVQQNSFRSLDGKLTVASSV